MTTTEPTPTSPPPETVQKGGGDVLAPRPCGEVDREIRPWRFEA
jgi:hypothetical protein